MRRASSTRCGGWARSGCWAFPARCAGGLPPCARMSRPTPNLPTVCSQRRLRTWPGRTRPGPYGPARWRAGYLSPSLGGSMTRAPAPRRSSRRHARSATRSCCGKPWPPTGSWPPSGRGWAGDRLREAVQLPGFTDTPFPYWAPETALAAWYLWRGELDPARDLLNAVIAVSERHGSDESASLTRINLVQVEWRAGNWDAAAAYA